MFTDHLSLLLQAGSGGRGIVAWRRSKLIPCGGACGGDGGRGGNIYAIANEQISSLSHLCSQPAIKAESGKAGGKEGKRGRNGQDLVLQFPCGTSLTSDGQVIAELMNHGHRLLLCQGGAGGKGNGSLTSSRRTAPSRATVGELGEEKRITCQLQLIADVALVGLPNAGKSSLLAALTNAHPARAAYPFTTLRPQLGTLLLDDYRQLVIADIPGIIAGAHRGKGLGLTFLKHIFRTRLLLFVLDAGRDPIGDLSLLRSELATYDPTLLERPYLIALHKIDIAKGIPTLGIPCSALCQIGLGSLKAALQEELARAGIEPTTRGSSILCSTY